MAAVNNLVNQTTVTQTAGNNTTLMASTAFVTSAVASGSTPGFPFVTLTTNMIVAGLMPGVTWNAGTSGGITQTTGTLYLYPIVIPITQTFTTISSAVLTGTSATNANMCLYNSTANNAPTGSPIVNSTTGSLSTASSASVISFSFSTAITLSAGLYWVGFSCSSSTPAFNGFTNTSTQGVCQATITFGAVSLPTIASTYGSQVIGYTQTFVYSATMPAIGTLTQLNIPAGSTGISMPLVGLTAQ